MNMIAFDTLKFTQKMQAAGMSSEEAVALAEALSDTWANIFPTKVDLIKVESDLKSAIQDLRTELKAEIQDLRTELKTDIQDVRNEMQDLRTELKADINNMIWKLAGMFTLIVGVMQGAEYLLG